jgi:hypothetical protein
MMRAFAALFMLAGCASVPPGAAHLEVRAELGEARVVRVDRGAVLTGTSLFLAPGRHRLGVYCAYNAGMMIGDAQHETREIDVDLAASRRYVLVAGMSPAPCSLRIAEER